MKALQAATVFRGLRRSYSMSLDLLPPDRLSPIARCFRLWERCRIFFVQRARLDEFLRVARFLCRRDARAPRRGACDLERVFGRVFEKGCNGRGLPAREPYQFQVYRYEEEGSEKRA